VDPVIGNRYDAMVRPNQKRIPTDQLPHDVHVLATLAKTVRGATALTVGADDLVGGSREKPIVDEHAIGTRAASQLVRAVLANHTSYCPATAFDGDQVRAPRVRLKVEDHVVRPIMFPRERLPAVANELIGEPSVQAGWLL